MAEIKNTFLKSKMNKDLDHRIVPNGEYRDAQNIAISKSEGADVGALENVLGNVIATDLGLSAECGLNVIGKFMDDTNNRIIVLLTDYTDTSADKLSNFASANSLCYIMAYYPNTNTVNTLVSGYFLNFSKTHPIYGINLLEDLLFWTDNRNQPRKINILKAENDATYYTKEDQISVAKYYPWKPIDLYKEAVSTYVLGGTNTGYSTGINIPVTGGSGEGMLINIDTIGGGGAIATLTIIESGVGYQNGDIVTVTTGGANATLTLTTTYQSTMRDVVSEKLPDPTTVNVTDTAAWVTTAGTGYTAATVATTTLTGNGQGLTVTITVAAGAVATATPVKLGHGYEAGDTVQVIGGNSDAVLTIPAVGTANPYYNSDYPGDSQYLKDKLVRFSYRFRFEDNENSLIAPFTQIAFIPENDGYFLQFDEDKTFKSTEVDFMRNKVNEIGLIINTPHGYTWNTIADELKINAIDILYKESNGAVIRIIETIPKEEFPTRGSLLEYKYQSTKPWKTLPEKETVRVYDRVPIRALGQEVSGNRVMYGNFIENHTPPPNLDYNVSISEKNTEAATPPSYVRKEYQNHTLKQNRNYQAAIILADRYGRQSNVILSSATSSVSTTLKGDTIYHPYKDSTFTSSDLISNTDTWPGDSMKITFNNIIPTSILSESGYPGIYAAVGSISAVNITIPGTGYTTTDDVATAYVSGSENGTGLIVDITAGAGPVTAVSIKNPGEGYAVGDTLQILGGNGYARIQVTALNEPNVLGWHTYKIVVKQSEQDYYNVYFPGILNGYINPIADAGFGNYAATNDNPICYFTIASDNINKIPRDLTKVGPEQKEFVTARPTFEDVKDAGLSFEGVSVTDMQFLLDNSNSMISPTIEDFLMDGIDAAREAEYQNLLTTWFVGKKDLVTENASVFLSPRVTNYVPNTSILNYPSSLIDSITTPFNGATNDTYTDLTPGVSAGVSTSGSGSGMKLSMTVSGGVATILTVTDPGTSYAIGDTITFATGTFGGSANQEVTLTEANFQATLNKRVNPGTKKDNVITIGTGIDQGLWDPQVTGSDTAPELYSWESNPLVGKVEVKDITIGAAAEGGTGYLGLSNVSMRPALAVYETEPGISNLDLFWETGTCGSVIELNNNILNNDNTIPMSFQAINFNLNENMASGTTITSSFAALAPDGTTVLTAATMSIYSIVDNYGTNRSSEFTLVSDGSGAYHLETNGTFWWSADPNLRMFGITIQVTNGSISNNIGFLGLMGNTGPTITTPASATPSKSISLAAGSIDKMIANNGSANTSDQGRELTWAITSQTNSSGATVTSFYLNPLGTGKCSLLNYEIEDADTYTVAIDVTGAGGLTDTVTYTITAS
tara:strand:+ start:1946 stop:6016 length:4071 start_codon:yes stop_codon:yes gene_type:complete